MARRRKTPRWLSRLVVEAIHVEQIREHGGLQGLRDENVLESALARAQQRWHYDTEVDLYRLAAAYAFGIARSHPFRDGNKRTAFLAMVTFLGLNGLDFDAPETAVVTQFLLLAEGAVKEEDLSKWIRRHTAPLAD